MVFRIEVDAFPIVFYNETDYIAYRKIKRRFSVVLEKKGIEGDGK